MKKKTILRITESIVVTALLCFSFLSAVSLVAMATAHGDPDMPMFVASMITFTIEAIAFIPCAILYASSRTGRIILRYLFVIPAVVISLQFIPFDKVNPGEFYSGMEGTKNLQKSEWTDISGEWAVKWEDPRSGDKETIYIFISQDGSQLQGDALDSHLIPAGVHGVLSSEKIRFTVDPSRGTAPFQTVPMGFYSGILLDDQTMEGTWFVNRRKGVIPRRINGSWAGRKTASGTNRTVTVSEDLCLTLPLSEDEYDLLFYNPSPSNHGEDYDRRYAEQKSAKKVGDHYAIEMSVWRLLHRHRFQGEMASYGEKSYTTEEDKQTATIRRSIQEKIASVLYENGFPKSWGP